MKTLKTIAFAMLVASLTACSSDDKGSIPKYINIQAEVSPVTRTTTAADGSMAFTSGDAISVYAWTGSKDLLPSTADGFVVNNASNSFGGTKWTAVPQMLWKDLVTPHFFLAVYPKRDILDKSFTLNVNDQTQCDILVATNLGTDGAGIIATETAIPLTFDHLMAKLQVNLLFRNQWGDDGPSSVTVSANAKSKANINFLTKSVTPIDQNAYIALPSVASLVEGYTSYESILLPQSDFGTLKITVEGRDYIYTHEGGIQLQAGKTTVVNLVVGRNEITLGSLSIKGWESAVVIGDNDKPIEVTD